MAYKPNIPQSTDRLDNVSQADLLGNFGAIKTFIDVNHVTFDTANQGKHKFITMPLVTVDPVIEDAQVALFSKLDSTTDLAAQAELFVKKDADGDAIDITASKNTLGGTLGTMNSGWSRLCDGSIIKWCGNAWAPGPYGTFTIGWAAFGPAFTRFHTAYANIRLPGAAENKWIQVKSFDIPTQALTMYSYPRYGNIADISAFYVDCFVIGAE